MNSVPGTVPQAEADRSDGAARAPFRRTDFLGLALFCLLLFGYSAVSGRPLSLHEARLPQCSREMMSNGDWVIPRSGGRPWLERPPLPHWVTIGVNALMGQRCDRVWAVRVPAAVAGLLTVLMVAWIAGQCFGRWTGVCAGLVLATMYEFYAYASLAEDDIFLAAVVAAAVTCFVAAQFPRPGSVGESSVRFWGRRPLSVVGVFLFLGLSNLAKGPLVGATVVGATCIAYLAPMGVRALRRYVWAWGWLAFAGLAVAWPLLVVHRYPEVWSNWRFDYAGGTSQYDQPVWYYLGALFVGTLPWTPAVVAGMRSTAEIARRAAASPERFLWCWAILPVIVLSIPHRKHHHYLVPNLAPWAILASLGLRSVARSMFAGPLWSRRPSFGVLAIGLPGALALCAFRSRIPPAPLGGVVLALLWVGCVTGFYIGLYRTSGRILLGTFVLGVSLAYCWGQSYIPDQTTEDTAFLRRVEESVPAGAPLLINADLHGELDFFRIAFYLRPDAHLLHNLTFLRAEQLRATELYVITRRHDQEKLGQLGEVDPVLESRRTRREKSPDDRFALFRLRLLPGLQRYPAPPPDSISTMEAMGRKKGPYLGPPL